MKKAIALILCGIIAGCSQTGSTTTASGSAAATTSTKPATKAQARKQQTAAARCQEAMKAQTNAAMLGGALSMVGGFGGFAGRGGAVVAQAASVGGSLMQAKAQNDANKAVETDCLS